MASTTFVFTAPLNTKNACSVATVAQATNSIDEINSKKVIITSAVNICEFNTSATNNDIVAQTNF
jgi:hypothetical protein